MPTVTYIEMRPYTDAVFAHYCVLYDNNENNATTLDIIKYRIEIFDCYFVCPWEVLINNRL